MPLLGQAPCSSSSSSSSTQQLDVQGPTALHTMGNQAVSPLACTGLDKLLTLILLLLLLLILCVPTKTAYGCKCKSNWTFAGREQIHGYCDAPDASGKLL